MNGVLNIDKPAGMTSHDVVAVVRKVVGQKRVGHAGTLDPDATGVLLVCLGHATRLSDFLADRGKGYEAMLRLGISTGTEDSSGFVIAEHDPSAITETALANILPAFTGKIEQTPPMVSAVHHHGQRLYELARKGITVEREARLIEIESIELTAFHPGVECSAILRVRCGKGAYIRTLCADIGAALGVGGHMASLRRTSVGAFDIGEAVLLSDLTPENAGEKMVSSVEAAAFLERFELDESAASDILNGKAVLPDREFTHGSLVRLIRNGELLGLARFAEGTLKPEKVFPPDMPANG